MKAASLRHHPTAQQHGVVGGDPEGLLLLADGDHEHHDDDGHHMSSISVDDDEEEEEAAASSLAAAAANQQEASRHDVDKKDVGSSSSTGVGGSGAGSRSAVADERPQEAPAPGLSRISTTINNTHRATNYLAPLQCFKKKKKADRAGDKSDGDGTGDPRAGASLAPPNKGNQRGVRSVLDRNQSHHGRMLDDVDMDGDDGACGSAEVPSSPPPPPRKPPKPPSRRSTTTTLATMESGSGCDEDDDGRNEDLEEEEEEEEEGENMGEIPGTLELRDVGNDDDDKDDNVIGGGEGVEVTIRQYIWKQRWDRFYYGFLRRRATPTIPQGGCYNAGASPAGVKVVGEHGEMNDLAATRRRRRRRLVPVLVAFGAATILLVIVAAASACGSGRCGASSKGNAASSAHAPENNNNPNLPPFGDTTSASPASAPSSSGAPVSGNGEAPSPTPLPADNPWMDKTPEPTWAKSDPVTLSSATELYCYPSYYDRTRYSNVWPSSTASSGYTVEAKEGSYCGPGNNHFSPANVNFDVGDHVLVLQYRQVNGLWTGSEVRVVLPDDLMPYTYGTYAFSVRNVSFTDAMGQPKNGNVLSEDLVVGFFTWDDTERYDVHENWNHEVDVELSRWGDPSNEDAQFVIQPPEVPHYHRFFSGAGSTLNPGGQSYQFTWYPTNVTWHASGTGESYAYTTRMAIEQNLPDRIQCLPANVEVRMNIWNLKGADATPSGMSDTDVVHVVIDNFSFTPVDVVGVDDGQLCSKHCQCSGETSLCVASVCTPA